MLMRKVVEERLAKDHINNKDDPIFGLSLSILQRIYSFTSNDKKLRDNWHTAIETIMNEIRFFQP